MGATIYPQKGGMLLLGHVGVIVGIRLQIFTVRIIDKSNKFSSKVRRVLSADDVAFFQTHP